MSEIGRFVDFRGRFLKMNGGGSQVVGLFLGVAVLTGSLLALGEPILHELFAPDPEEDLRLGATNSSGTMPAVMETKSGWVNAPDPIERSPNHQTTSAYGGSKASSEFDQEFALDNLTTRPLTVQYDEPFRPSILPYKRWSAFDGLQNDYHLHVVDRQLELVEVGGRVNTGEDAFFGDFEVDLVAGVAVRIPTVGPDARLLALDVDPPRTVEVLKDSADNWFMRGSEGGRVRALVQLSIDRRIFGSQFAPVSRQALRPYLSVLPARAYEVAEEVLNQIGDFSERSPASALNQFVSYFRTFEESNELPRATEPLALYREISLSKKGVCRHRAFAFVVTALAWGIPARLVVNEAHAWVEVFDTEIWHRIDLGGAASDLVPTRNEPLAARHRAPRDPFSWPTSERAASTEFERRLAQTRPETLDHVSSGTTASNTSSSFGASTPSGTPTPGDVSDADPSSAVDANSNGNSDFNWNDPTAAAAATATSSAIQVEVHVEGSSYRRGSPVAVSGHASIEGQGCALSRVDIQLNLPFGPKTIGSLATDRQGRFSGQVTLPSELPVGRVSIAARLGAGCRLP